MAKAIQTWKHTVDKRRGHCLIVAFRMICTVCVVSFIYFDDLSPCICRWVCSHILVWENCFFILRVLFCLLIFDSINNFSSVLLVVRVRFNRHQAKMKSYEQSIEEKSRDLIEIQSRNSCKILCVCCRRTQTVHIHANPRKQQSSVFVVLNVNIYLVFRSALASFSFHFPCALSLWDVILFSNKIHTRLSVNEAN